MLFDPSTSWSLFMWRNNASLALCVGTAVLLGVAGCLPTLTFAGERPFKARLEGNAHLEGSPPIVENHETGEGHATHLGRFIWEDVEFVDFSLFPAQLSVVGTFTMTSANGHKLFGSLMTTAIPDLATGILVIEGDFTFNGGTGRFADATGSGTLEAIASILGDLPFAGTLKGTI